VKTTKETVMTVTADLPQTEARSVRANGIDIHYLETGEGELAVVPGTGHVITPPLVELMVEFLERWS
jgi:hypothetical protein